MDGFNPYDWHHNPIYSDALDTKLTDDTEEQDLFDENETTELTIMENPLDQNNLDSDYLPKEAAPQKRRPSTIACSGHDRAVSGFNLKSDLMRPSPAARLSSIASPNCSGAVGFRPKSHLMGPSPRCPALPSSSIASPNCSGAVSGYHFKSHLMRFHPKSQMGPSPRRPALLLDRLP